MRDGYRRIGSFETAGVDGVGVGDGAIAVGSGDRVVVVTGDDRTEIDHGERVVDVALADRVLVLSADSLTTYSRDGDRIRRQSVADAHAIAAVDEAALVGVLGPDRLRAVDVATGRERFDVERARPGGPSDDAVIGTPEGFVVATWSFLTRIGLDGEVGFDRNLEAVVRSLGRCDDAIVAALQNDRLVAADLETGQSRWQTDVAADHVAPVGESSVPVGTADGVRAVDPDGTTASVAGLSSGEAYATADGALVCAIRDGTASIHRYDRDPLRVTVATDAVGVGGTVDVEATNATDDERRVSLTARLDGAALSPSERTATIAPGETALASFPVESVRTEGETTLEVAAGDSVVERAAIELEDAPSDEIAVETTLEATAIDHGVAELAATVENVGDATLEAVRLLEADAATEDLDPGEEWTGTVTRPYEPDRRVSVGVEAVCGDRSREYAPTCTLPPAPTIDVELDRDAVRATVGTDGAVTVDDRLVIELPGAGRVRTDVTIEREELLLVVPTFEDGTARLAFESIDVDERFRLSGGGPGSLARSPRTGGSSATRSDRDRTSRTDAGRAGSAPGSTDGSASDGTEPEFVDSSAGSDGDAPSDSASSESVADESRAAVPNEGAAPPAEAAIEPGAGDGAATESGGGQASDDSRSDEPRLVATRRVDGEPAPVGHAVRDRIVLENEGRSAATVAVDVGESTVDVGRLGPGERTTLERSVAALSSDEPELAPVSVTVDGTAHERLSGRSVAVSDDGLAARTAVDPADGNVAAVFENRDDRPRSIRALEIDGREIAVETRLEAGETASVTGRLDGWSGTDADALDGTVVAADADGTERRFDIVAAVSSVASGGNDDPFRIAIGRETTAAGEYGTVVLVFENEGDRPVSDVAVSAAGEAINDLFYSEARRDRLDPGDRIEHFVDLEPGVSEPTFDATVRYALDDADREYTVRAAGPSVEDEADWTDEHRERWSVERVGTESAGPDAPSSLARPFRRE